MNLRRRWGILLGAMVWGAALFGVAEAGVKVVLKNNSFENIVVAINYLAPNGRWITRGWWDVPSGKSVEPNVTSENTHFYFYAEGDNGGRWNGEDDAEGISRWVVDEKFDHYDDQKGNPAGSNGRQVSFFHAEAKNGVVEQKFSD